MNLLYCSVEIKCEWIVEVLDFERLILVFCDMFFVNFMRFLNINLVICEDYVILVRCLWFDGVDVKRFRKLFIRMDDYVYR